MLINTSLEPIMEKIDKALQTATQWMDTIAGVTGVGQGITADGKDAVMVFVTDTRTIKQIPQVIDGVPVLFTVSDEISAQ
jgi:hypothetical protein